MEAVTFKDQYIFPVSASNFTKSPEELIMTSSPVLEIAKDRKFCDFIKDFKVLISETLDPLLISTIPTLSGRYNYIPSLKTLTPTSINSTILALANAKKILGLSDKFDQFINSSCGLGNAERDVVDLKLSHICENFFYSYFVIEKGSFSYLIRSKSIPEDLIVPEKNRESNKIYYTEINFKNIKETYDKDFPLPEYIVIGPTEKQFINKENYSDLYEEVFSTENYQIFEMKN